MSFYDDLLLATEADRQYLLDAPAISDPLAGDISLPRYVSFLTEAYHHVKHTTPCTSPALTTSARARTRAHTSPLSMKNKFCR